MLCPVVFRTHRREVTTALGVHSLAAGALQVPWNTKGITVASDLHLKFSKPAAATDSRQLWRRAHLRNPSGAEGLNQGST